MPVASSSRTSPKCAARRRLLQQVLSAQERVQILKHVVGLDLEPTTLLQVLVGWASEVSLFHKLGNSESNSLICNTVRVDSRYAVTCLQSWMLFEPPGSGTVSHVSREVSISKALAKAVPTSCSRGALAFSAWRLRVDVI